MKKLLNITALLSLAILMGLANPLSLFQGTFATDDQVALFNITANTSEAITIETYSYASGTVGSTLIPAGGFVPTAFLFDNLGDVQVLTNGTCSPVGQDPATGNCNDLYFQDTLAPGAYTLPLAVVNSSPVDTSVAEGFVEDGDSGFTCLEAGTSGSFCDLTTALGTTRTGNYAISVSGTDSVVNLPDPSSVFLLSLVAI